MEEGIGWIKERKVGMAKKEEFPLLEVLRLWIFLLESYETWCVFSFGFLLLL